MRHMSICAIPGCGRPRAAHGLCGAHLARRASGADLYAEVRAKRRYSADDVHEAVDAARVLGVRMAARALGIPTATLARWAQEDRLTRRPTRPR